MTKWKCTQLFVALKPTFCRGVKSRHEVGIEPGDYMRHVCASSPHFCGLDERHPLHSYLSPASEHTNSADLQRIQYARNSSFIWLHWGEMKDFAVALGTDALCTAFISCMFLLTFYTFCASKKSLNINLCTPAVLWPFVQPSMNIRTSHLVGKGEESSHMYPEMEHKALLFCK